MKKILLGLALSLFFILPTSAAEFNTNLKYGSKGADVTKLQEFLAEQDLYTGPITGNFFSLTLKAVKAFQLREAINPVSGFFGNLTRARVNTILDTQLVDSEVEAVSDPVVSEPAPVSAEVLRLNEILGAVQSQNQLLQAQNQTLENNLVTQQNSLNQLVENTQPVVVPVLVPEPIPVASTPIPAPQVDPLKQIPCSLLSYLTKCDMGMWTDGRVTRLAVRERAEQNGSDMIFRLFYWNGTQWMTKESFFTIEQSLAEFNSMVDRYNGR
jgi:hypothetical protein